MWYLVSGYVTTTGLRTFLWERATTGQMAQYVTHEFKKRTSGQMLEDVQDGGLHVVVVVEARASLRPRGSDAWQVWALTGLDLPYPTPRCVLPRFTFPCNLNLALDVVANQWRLIIHLVFEWLSGFVRAGRGGHRSDARLRQTQLRHNQPPWSTMEIFMQIAGSGNRLFKNTTGGGPVQINTDGPRETHSSIQLHRNVWASHNFKFHFLYDAWNSVLDDGSQLG